MKRPSATPTTSIPALTLLDSLWDELHRGRVYECSLRSPTWQVAGLQHGENVYIDPRPLIIETVLHELLHRLKPRWGERRVRREAERLLAHLEEPDKQRWWAAYRKIRKVSKPVDVED